MQGCSPQRRLSQLLRLLHADSPSWQPFQDLCQAKVSEPWTIAIWYWTILCGGVILCIIKCLVASRAPINSVGVQNVPKHWQMSPWR